MAWRGGRRGREARGTARVPASLSSTAADRAPRRAPLLCHPIAGLGDAPPRRAWYRVPTGTRPVGLSRAPIAPRAYQRVMNQEADVSKEELSVSLGTVPARRRGHGARGAVSVVPAPRRARRRRHRAQGRVDVLARAVAVPSRCSGSIDECCAVGGEGLGKGSQGNMPSGGNPPPRCPRAKGRYRTGGGNVTLHCA